VLGLCIDSGSEAAPETPRIDAKELESLMRPRLVSLPESGMGPVPATPKSSGRQMSLGQMESWN